MAGSTVILKHSDQTPLCRTVGRAFVTQALPHGVFQYLHANHDIAQRSRARDRLHTTAGAGA